MKRTEFIILGSFFTGLGALGVFIPVLPTTPFLLLAAYFYANSSDRLYRWILNSPLFGDYIRHYREGGGVSVVKKVLVILFLWITLGYTALAVVNPGGEKPCCSSLQPASPGTSSGSKPHPPPPCRAQR